MRRLHTHRLTSFVVACVVMLGVGGAADADAPSAAAPQTARVGREFKIRVGRTVTLKGENLRLRFSKVSNDSRCPEGVECVWAGNAEVLIEAGSKGGRGGTTLKLNTNASPERPAEGRYGRYVVKLTGLSPYPRAGRKIKSGEYTATLLVSKRDDR